MSATPGLMERAVRLGNEVDGHPEQAGTIVPQLVAMLAVTDDADTVTEIARALGKAGTADARLALLPLADWSDAAVRLAVAQALPGAGGADNGEEAVVGALIRLSVDPADEVRDRATFGLGSILDVDSREVRDALLSARSCGSRP